MTNIVVVASTDLFKTDLSARIKNALAYAGIKTVGDVLARDPREILKIKHVGRGSLREIRAFVRSNSLDWPKDRAVVPAPAWASVCARIHQIELRALALTGAHRKVIAEALRQAADRIGT